MIIVDTLFVRLKNITFVLDIRNVFTNIVNFLTLDIFMHKVFCKNIVFKF